jgi:hypothetical protein
MAAALDYLAVLGMWAAVALVVWALSRHRLDRLVLAAGLFLLPSWLSFRSGTSGMAPTPGSLSGVLKTDVFETVMWHMIDQSMREVK